MTALGKGAIVAVVDAGLILALAWSAAKDVNRWPRAWADGLIGRGTAPGSHYVNLNLQVPTRDLPEDRPNGPCRLEIQHDLVVCVFDPQGRHWIPPGKERVLAPSYRYRLTEAGVPFEVGTRVQAEVALAPDGRLKVLRISPAARPRHGMIEVRSGFGSKCPTIPLQIL
jgi:hypothetical protein